MQTPDGQRQIRPGVGGSHLMSAARQAQASLHLPGQVSFPTGIDNYKYYIGFLRILQSK